MKNNCYNINYSKYDRQGKLYCVEEDIGNEGSSLDRVAIITKNCFGYIKTTRMPYLDGVAGVYREVIRFYTSYFKDYLSFTNMKFSDKYYSITGFEDVDERHIEIIYYLTYMQQNTRITK